MHYKIGVDIGTTSTKAVLYDENYHICAIANEGYPTLRPSLEKAEQDPRQIYAAFLRAVKKLTSQVEAGNSISSLLFSSAMHAVIAVDEHGEPLTNMWLWSDNRAQKQTAALKQKGEGWLEIYRKTGTPVHPMSPLTKLLWMQSESTLLIDAGKFIGIKEYIFYQLTGKYVIDYSIASATGLFNIHTCEWDAAILGLLGLKPSQLSEPVDVITEFSFQNPELVQELGLSADTKLIIGASDGCLANLGAGAKAIGEVAMTIGTSGAVRMTLDKPYLDEQGRTFCYYLSSGKWVIGGAVNNGGNVMEWLNTILYEKGGSNVYAELADALDTIEPGADGLLFIPYLNGERAPVWDGMARGTLHGLSAFQTKKHVIRASLEGIMFNLKEVLSILEEIGGEVKAIKASGGFLKSPQWAQLAADILGYPLTITHSPESSSLGAVLINDQEGIAFSEGMTITPQEELSEKYATIYADYLEYRDALRRIELKKNTR